MEMSDVLSSSRPRWVQGVAGATILSAFCGQSSSQSTSGGYGLLWGDMQNHNAVGYALGPSRFTPGSECHPDASYLPTVCR
jgi:hypothetical protein